MTETNGERAVAREIEKEVEAVGVHIAGEMQRIARRLEMVHPVGADERSEDEFVEEAAKDAVHREVEVIEKLHARSAVIVILREPPVSVDRSGGDRRKEEEER